MLLRVWLVLFLALACQGANEGRHAKLERLVTQRGAFLPVTLDQYTLFVLNPDRDYNAVVAIVAGEKFECLNCVEVVNVLHRLSKEYRARGKMQQRADGKLATFFFLLNLSVDMRFAQIHGLATVPHVVFLTPADNLKFNQASIAPIPRDLLLPMEEVEAGIRSDVIVDFVNSKAGEAVSLPVDNRKLALMGTALALAFVCLLALLQLVRRHPKLLAIVAVLAQIATTSCLCWTIINDVPFTQYDYKLRQRVWFSSKPRQQLGAEGFIMSTATVLSGMLLLLAGYLMKTPFLRKSGLSYSIAFMVVFLSFTLHQWVLNMFYMKMRIPPLTIYPPAHYITGPLQADRGNAF